MHAIGSYVHEHYPNYEVRYVSTETFLNEYVDGIRNNTISAFKRRYREVDVLLIDDVQFMEGKEGLQEEFFHTFNSLHGSGKQIVISSDRVPDAIPTLEDRLRGRFRWGLITDIQPPDVETRLAILRNKAERERLDASPDVLEFIASSVTTNIRELEGALVRVAAYASLNRTHIDIELARQLLVDLVTRRVGKQRPADQLLREICDYLATRLLAQGWAVELIRATGAPGDSDAFPHGPGFCGGKAHFGIFAGQAAVIGGDQVAALGFGNRGLELLEGVGEQHPGAVLIEPVQLWPGQQEDAPQQQGRDPFGMGDGIGHSQGRTPAAAEYDPFVDTEQFAKAFDVLDQRPGGVVLQRRIGAALAAAALVEQDDPVFRRIEIAPHARIDRPPGSAVQNDHRKALRIAGFLIVDLVYAAGRHEA